MQILSLVSIIEELKHQTALIDSDRKQSSEQAMNRAEDLGLDLYGWTDQIMSAVNGPYYIITYIITWVHQTTDQQGEMPIDCKKNNSQEFNNSYNSLCKKF